MLWLLKSHPQLSPLFSPCFLWWIEGKLWKVKYKEKIKIKKCCRPEKVRTGKKSLWIPRGPFLNLLSGDHEEDHRQEKMMGTSSKLTEKKEKWHSAISDFLLYYFFCFIMFIIFYALFLLYSVHYVFCFIIFVAFRSALFLAFADWLFNHLILNSEERTSNTQGVWTINSE